jgi:hypothetical protein
MLTHTHVHAQAQYNFQNFMSIKIFFPQIYRVLMFGATT